MRSEIEDFRVFIAHCRRANPDLALKPEVSLVEQLVTLEGKPKFQCLRESLDRFGIFGKGLEVVDELCNEAKALGYPSVATGLYELETQLRELFLGQFNYYPAGVTYPQSDILRSLVHAMCDGDFPKVKALIDQHIMDLDGHFFLILGETMRIARSKGSSVTVDGLLLLGGEVARARRKGALPCSFAYLYTAIEG
jgi:hypothetical protein